jgi:hypothetical protein
VIPAISIMYGNSRLYFSFVVFISRMLFVQFGCISQQAIYNFLLQETRSFSIIIRNQLLLISSFNSSIISFTLSRGEILYAF